ncbi:MAG: SPFH domain-containing protein, partial [Patescibacteria group bacterium]
MMRLFGIIMIPDDGIGIINKKFVLFGANKSLPDGAIIAMNGEAGIQANTLPPGIHFLYWPWQYEISFQSFITVPIGSVGVVESRDGKPLAQGRVLAKNADCDMFQNATKFLQEGGERGIQINVIPPGTYRINTGLFTVKFEKAIQIGDNMVGIVTTKEGKPLPTGEIAGRETSGHNMYQDGQTFVNNGGFKGLQEQVMLAGTYFINPYFIEVEQVKMTEVPIAHAGVVIAYVGEAGQDVTGDAFKHGNLCAKWQKGVWVEPLDPGKYAINPYTHKVELVPTANIVLNWATGKTEAHKLDERLSTITVRSADGFTFNLDVSQIIHIPRTESPKVIARFGTVANLVTQVLEPIIGNYFRNTAQASDVIDFLKQRTTRQQEAKAAIKAALDEYNVNAVDTLIGDITPPKELMKTLTDKKVAELEKSTFETQKEAQTKRQELEQATALANTQKQVVDAERQVTIKQFAASAAIEQSKGVAQSRVIESEGEATSKKNIAAADAEV